MIYLVKLKGRVKNPPLEETKHRDTEYTEAG